MYRIDINDIKELCLFLNLNDNEYVDLIINNQTAILISDTNELFATVTLKVVNVNEENNFSVRIPRKLFANLISVGYVQIVVSESEITLQFYEIREEYNAERTCSVTFSRQNIFTENYRSKLQLLTEIDYDCSVNLKDLADIAGMGNKNRCIIDCNSKIACLNMSDSFKICKPIDAAVNFSISASSLITLLRISPDIFQYKNYVGVNKGNMVLLCNTVRGNANGDYATIHERKASFRANADLEYLIRFINNVKIDTKDVLIDLENSNCDILSNTKKFSIPVMVRNLEKNPVCSSCSIRIPTITLSAIAKIMKGNIVKIHNKKNFIQIDIGNNFIIYRS